MSFDLLTLKYLTEVDKTGSISRAAHNLFISQPHLSNIIRNTEQELGAALFRRSVKGVEATDEGRLFRAVPGTFWSRRTHLKASFACRLRTA